MRSSPAPISPYGVSKLVGEATDRYFSGCTGSNSWRCDISTCSGRGRTPGRLIRGCCRYLMPPLKRGRSRLCMAMASNRATLFMSATWSEANVLACEARERAGTRHQHRHGRPHTLNQTLALLEKITGRPAKAKYAEPREGDIRDSQADIGLARDLLGYSPSIGFEEGLKQTWEWFSCSRKMPNGS